MKGMNNTVQAYVTDKGQVPYTDWLRSLKDLKGKVIITAHVDKMELGVFGNAKSIGDGVSELKIQFGPGYRVYYAQEGKNIYLLLCGGDKSSQKNDIKLAKQYWKDHKTRR